MPSANIDMALQPSFARFEHTVANSDGCLAHVVSVDSPNLATHAAPVGYAAFAILLHRGIAGFTGANANSLFKIGDENLAVADLARACRIGDCLYDLLRDDIERSRQLYKERVPEAVRAGSSYFNDELIRILADGDSGAMGSLPAG